METITERSVRVMLKYHILKSFDAVAATEPFSTGSARRFYSQGLDCLVRKIRRDPLNLHTAWLIKKLSADEGLDETAYAQLVESWINRGLADPAAQRYWLQIPHNSDYPTVKELFAFLIDIYHSELVGLCKSSFCTTSYDTPLACSVHGLDKAADSLYNRYQARLYSWEDRLVKKVDFTGQLASKRMAWFLDNMDMSPYQRCVVRRNDLLHEGWQVYKMIPNREKDRYPSYRKPPHRWQVTFYDTEDYAIEVQHFDGQIDYALLESMLHRLEAFYYSVAFHRPDKGDNSFFFETYKLNKGCPCPDTGKALLLEIIQTRLAEADAFQPLLEKDKAESARCGLLPDSPV